MSTKETKTSLRPQEITLKEPTIDTVGNTISVTYSKDEFLENSPVSKEVIVTLENFQKDYMEKVTDSVTDIAIERFKQGEDVSKVVGNAPYMSNDTLSIQTIRDYEIVDNEGNKTNDPEVIVIIEEKNKHIDMIKDMKGKIKKAIIGVDDE